MKFHNYIYVDEKAQKSDFMKAHFLIKPAQSYRYRFCNVDFEFNNQLHKHLRIIYSKSRFLIRDVIVMNFNAAITIVILIEIISFTTMTFYISKVVHLNVMNVTIKEYAFREHRFVIVLMMFVLVK